MVFFQHLSLKTLVCMCVYVVCITYVRILVLKINRVSFYKELSLECDFKYFFLICQDDANLARI